VAKKQAKEAVAIQKPVQCNGAGQEYECGCHKERKDRYLEPSLLLLLWQGPSYGYELMRGLEALGFHDGPPDPGAVYRTLRHMEEYGLVRSEWETTGSGPARRRYWITDRGKHYLANWVEVLEQRYWALGNFLRQYRQLLEAEKGGSDGRSGVA
jgi:poly-beta-hydroxybutyrate-responsive repressor